MERRTFVQTGAASVLGFALHPDVFSILQPVKDNIQDWLMVFQKSMNARVIRASRIMSNNDLQAIKSLDEYFAKRFYHRESNSVYTIQHNNASYFFYPVFLRNASASLSDVLVPVFVQQSDLGWKHLGTFTGFQLEAIAQASVANKDQEWNLADMLLPVEIDKTSGPELQYTSLNARISIKTVVKDKAHTTIRIVQGNKQVLDWSFASKHCLHAKGVV